METQQKINQLQSRQLELRAIMAASDDRAAKCFKRGGAFREEYPEEFARYEAANAEYNHNERTLARLLEEYMAESQSQEQPRPCLT